MAFDPVGFLVAPKFLAMIVMLPALTVWANLMGAVGGSLFGVLGANYTFFSYFKATLDAVVLNDLFTGLTKSVVFAVVITAVGCREGFGTGAGAEEVGRSTTSAVVTSIFMVVLVDMVFTTLFYLTSGAKG
jgi:phospholipid/cholesterol/gamma-HCH transport system permease protein